MAMSFHLLVQSSGLSRAQDGSPLQRPEQEFAGQLASDAWVFQQDGCTGCHKRRALSEYWRSSRFSDRLSRRCKACCAAPRRRSYHKNRKLFLAYQRDYDAHMPRSLHRSKKPTTSNIVPES